MKGDWTFEDPEVVDKFQDIAKKNIPGYDVVVNYCADYVTKEYPKDARIVDVGSALGWTLKHFWARDFTDLTGIDTSKAMVDRARMDTTLREVKFFHSPHFVGGQYDVVLANWTLHFIRNWNERVDYMAKISAHLKPGGVLILTDKVTVGPFSTEVYHEWKMRMGLTAEEVARKKEAIEGVLVTRPVGDYISALERLGLEVEIPLVFGPMVTMMCHKP